MVTWDSIKEKIKTNSMDGFFKIDKECSEAYIEEGQAVIELEDKSHCVLKFVVVKIPDRVLEMKKMENLLDEANKGFLNKELELLHKVPEDELKIRLENLLKEHNNDLHSLIWEYANEWRGGMDNRALNSLTAFVNEAIFGDINLPEEHQGASLVEMCGLMIIAGEEYDKKYPDDIV